MSVNSLRFEIATREDMEDIANIIRSTADWYEQILDDPADLAEHDVDDAWKERNFKRRKFYVAYNSENKPVGTISLQAFGETVYLGYVYLKDSATGQGYGRQMLDFAKKLSNKMQKDEMILMSHPKATWAIKAYKRFGFSRKFERKESILNYKDGVLQPYYEEGFHLYAYKL